MQFDRPEFSSMGEDASEARWTSAGLMSSPFTPDSHRSYPQAHSSQLEGRPPPPSHALSLSPSTTSDVSVGLTQMVTSDAFGQPLQDPDDAYEAEVGWGPALPPSSGPVLARGFKLPPSILEQGYNKEGLPRRPMNAYMIFARWRRMELKGEHCDLSTGEVSSLLSAEWKALDSATKNVFIRASADLKARFDARFPDYKYIRRPNGTRKRGSRGGKMYIPKGQQAEDALAGDGRPPTLAASSPTRWVSADEDELASDEGEGLYGALASAPAMEAPIQLPVPRPSTASGPSFPSFSQRVFSGPTQNTVPRNDRSLFAQPYAVASRGSRRSHRPADFPRPSQRYLPSRPMSIAVPVPPTMDSWAHPTRQPGPYPVSTPFSTTASLAGSRQQSLSPSVAGGSHNLFPPADYEPHSVVLHQLPPMSHQPTRRSGSIQGAFRAQLRSTGPDINPTPPSDASWNGGRLQVGLGLGDVIESDPKYEAYAGSGWKGADEAQWVATDGRRASGPSSDGYRPQPQWEQVPEQSPALSDSSFGSVPISSARSSFSYAPSVPSRMQLPTTPSPTPYDPASNRATFSSLHDQHLPPPPHHEHPHRHVSHQGRRVASESWATSAPAHPPPYPSQPRSASTRSTFPPLPLPYPDDRAEQPHIEWEPLPHAETEAAPAQAWSASMPLSSMQIRSEYYGYQEVGTWGSSTQL